MHVARRVIRLINFALRHVAKRMIADDGAQKERSNGTAA